MANPRPRFDHPLLRGGSRQRHRRLNCEKRVAKLIPERAKIVIVMALNLHQVAFVSHILAGKTAEAAYISAGYRPKSKDGSRIRRAFSETSGGCGAANSAAFFDPPGEGGAGFCWRMRHWQTLGPGSTTRSFGEAVGASSTAGIVRRGSPN